MEGRGEVGPAGLTRRGALGLEPREQPEPALPASAGRENLAHLGVENDRPDPPTMARQQDRCQVDQLQRRLALQHPRRAPVEGAAGVHQQPDVQAPLLVGEADVRPVGAGREFPIDESRIIAGAVLAHVGVLDPWAQVA